MAATVFVIEGDATNLKADAPRMQLETVFLQMAACMAQVADVDEGTVGHCMAFAPTPETLIAELVRGPIPRAVDSLLNAVNVSR